MDFHQLLAKMQQLDQPVGEASVQECGEPMGMTPPMGQPITPPPAPPSMSVNLNAQGMDNIEDLLKLITKVNPDAGPQDAGLPSLSTMPSLTPPGPSIGSLGNLDSGPLKMLPDFDKDNDDMPGGEHEPKTVDIDLGKIGGDQDDGEEQGPPEQGDDHVPGPGDQDDAGEEEDEGYDNRDAYQRDFDASQTGFGKPDREDDEGEDEQEDEAYANEPDTDVKSVDYMNNKLAGGMNKPKQMVKHSYRQGDNPMAMEGEELRAWIKSDLTRRLAEAKGAK